jgi:glyoxylase-like metal-dependent hydrolase (beta-lactamase superfamily II)
MTINRRTILAAAPAAAAALTAGAPALAQQAAPASSPASGSQQAPGFYRYKVGDIEVTAILDGFAPRPIEGFVRNAETAEVQKALEERFLSSNPLINTFTTLALRSGGRTILIDTGHGEMGPPTTGRLATILPMAGIDPAQVDTIVGSHFHGDHINGIRRRDGSATFPKAEIMVPAAEWAFWMNDERMNQAPEAMRGAFQNVRRVFGPIAKDVKQYEAGKEVVPGVTAVASYGHTPGHTALAIQSGNGRMLVLGDSAIHPALFVRNPDWSPVFDMDADAARATRRRMLDMAASERMQVAMYHAPFPSTGYVSKSGNGFEFIPVAWTGAI